MTQTDRHDPHPTVANPGTDRPLGPAIMRGFRTRCPNCGRGRMLHGYVEVNDHCASCNEALFHHRADDGPAYLTILAVAHLMTPLMMIVYKGFRPEPLVMFAIFATGTLVLSLGLLPRLKGVIVAIQWARRMYGFNTVTTSAPQPHMPS